MRSLLRAIIVGALTAATFSVAPPVKAATLPDFGLPAEGVVVERGESIWIISPQCASSMVATFKTGRTEVVRLTTSERYWSEYGLVSCRTSLTRGYSKTYVANYQLWTDSGNIDLTYLDPVALTNVVSYPVDKAIDLTWDAPSNATAITSYYVWVRNYERNYVAMQGTVKVANNSLHIPVPFNSEDWQVDITPITPFDNGLPTRLTAVANRLPAAPARATLVPGDHQIELLFSPATDESAKITSWTVRLQPSGQIVTLAGYETHAIITDGISNNVSYSVTVAGKNALGTGPTKASNSVTPRAIPFTPTGLKAVALGDTGARITWNQSRSDITGYKVTHVQSGQEISVPASAQWTEFENVLLSGTRASSNTFTVVAINDYVSSLPASTTTSLISNPPSDLYLEAGRGSIDASWSQPADALSDIASYSLTLSASDGSTKRVTVSGSSENVNVTGLQVSLTYTATIIANNKWGASLPSAQSNAVRPQDVPNSPNRVTTKQITAADESGVGLDVTLGAVDTNGCNLIQWAVQYSWSDNDGQHSEKVVQSAVLGVLHLTNLLSDIDYSLSVTATNCWGQSASNSFTIHTFPKPLPVLVASAAITSDGAVVATWDLPADSQATSLLVTLQPSNQSVQVSTKAKRVIFSNIVLGTQYTITIATKNAQGTSAAITSNTVISEIAPGPVSDLLITVDKSTNVAHISWQAPAETGAEITGYEVWVDSEQHSIISATALEIDGLVEGDIHSFSVFPINHLGNGPTTTDTFGLSMPTLDPDAQGTVIVWHLSNAVRSVRYVTIQKRVNSSKWRTVAKVRASRHSYNIKVAKKSDVFRVVTKAKTKVVKVKSSIFRIHL